MASGSHRRSVRAAGHDYSAGAYFVTVCTRDRSCLFGEIANDEVRLSALGQTAEDLWNAIPDHFPWVEHDAWVVMPNHIHAILNLTDGNRWGVQLNAPTIPRPREAASTAGSRSSRLAAISPPQGSLSVVVRTYKAALTREAKQRGIGVPVWQRGFFEHVIRTEADLQRVRTYIATNPQRWARDRENPSRQQ